MYRHLFVLFVLLAGITLLPRSPAPDEMKSCRQHPRLSSKCFSVRGRLSVYNGAPAIRLWKVGTKRILGISEQRFAEEGYRNIPEDIRTQLNQDVEIFGDYVVCPFTPQRQGEMQLVCIEEGKHLVVKKRE
jgi:hypothetical protein